MNNLNLIVPQLVLGLIFIAIGLVIGIIFERIFFNKLRKFSARTKWEGDTILIGALRGVVTFWFISAGAYGAILNIPMNQKFFNLLQKGLLVLIIFSITFFLAKTVTGFINLYSKKNEGILPSTSIFVNLAKLLVFLLGILIILQSVGISITPLLTALGVGGLAVALALQDTLSNLFSGLYLIVSKQIKPGDYVKLDSGEEGYVSDVTLRNTSIRMLANNMIVVPNSKLASAIITNYYQPVKEISVSIPVGVSYDSDLEQVERVTIEVAKEVIQVIPGSVKGFEPVVRYHTFAEFSINFSVVLRAREFVDQYLIKHEFIKRLHLRYRKEGIEIPYPVRTIIIKDRKGE